MRNHIVPDVAPRAGTMNLYLCLSPIAIALETTWGLMPLLSLLYNPQIIPP